MRNPRLVLFLAAATACGSNDGPIGSHPTAGTGTDTRTALSLPSGTATSTATTSSTTLPPVRTDAGVAPRCAFSVGAEAACVGDLYGSPGVPVDLYVLFDQSGSMATKDDGSTLRIDAVRDAVKQFLRDPGSDGLGVGLGYFGSQPLDCACTSCNPSDYQTPAVPIAELPGNAAPVLASLGAIAPTGETPTGAALRGSCAYAGDWKAKHPGRETAILLVTDGEPQAPLTTSKGGCAPTLADAVAAASACQSAHDVRVYVLGVGPSLANLNQIAQAGGTAAAYLVQNAGSDGVLAALNAIREDVQIPCALSIPRGNIVLSTLNLVYADSGCSLTTFPKVGAVSACGKEVAWYFDDPNTPSTLKLCPQACDRVSSPGGQLQLSVGCETVIIP
jgi:hypothetical protein